MTTTDAKIDFLGEMIGLDDLINRVEAMARIETSISDPWFIGECVYSCGNLPLTAPFETFGDFVNAFSNQQHLSSVTNDTGGLRFIFTVDGKPRLRAMQAGIPKDALPEADQLLRRVQTPVLLPGLGFRVHHSRLSHYVQLWMHLDLA